MSTEQESAVPQGPLGGVSNEAGFVVLRLLGNLLAPKTAMPFAPGEAPRWDETDRHGFDLFIALDEQMAVIHMPQNSDPLTGKLTEPWRQFTPTLPLTEAERHWMVSSAYKLDCKDVELSEGIVGVETTVISAGLQHVLQGRDLVRRWASWRREADEFAGQGSLSKAQILLNAMAHELVPTVYKRPDFRDQHPHVAKFDALP